MADDYVTDQRLAELRHLLDTYGAERTRWPAAARLRVSSVVAADPVAHTLLAEAAAFDRLLDLAPPVEAGREQALAARIMAAALAERPAANLPAQSPTSLAASTVPAAVRPLPRQQSRRPSTQQLAGLMLAASLVLGVFIGTRSQVYPALDSLAEAIGLSDDSPEVALLADQPTSTDDLL